MLGGTAAPTPVDLAHPVNCADHLPFIAAEETSPAWFNDLRRGPVREGKDGRPARQGLRHHQAEGLAPGNRVEHRVGAAQQLDPLLQRDLGWHLIARVEQRLDLRLEVGDLVVLAHLGAEHQPLAGLLGDADGVVHALVGRHPADEHDIAAAARTCLVEVEVDAVVDDSGDLGSAVHFGLIGLGLRDRHDRCVLGDLAEHRLRLAGERAVVGVHDRRPAHPAQARNQRAEERVVVDDVHVGQ